MQAFPIPVVALGPGSQPLDDDGLDYQPLPSLAPRPQPRVPDHLDGADLRRAALLLAAFEKEWRLAGDSPSSPPRLRLTRVAPKVVRALDESLGDGDVSIVVRKRTPGAGFAATDLPALRVQETAFSGLWRVSASRPDGAIGEQTLELAEIPERVRAACRRGRRTLSPWSERPGTMNAPAVLREVAHRAAKRKPGDPVHAMNLSLLPLTPEDRVLIDQVLGLGPVSFLSRGFGNCRIDSTVLRGVWRVRYFNNMETTILDAIEIADVPEAAAAAPEDIADGLERLPELIAWMREP